MTETVVEGLKTVITAVKTLKLDLFKSKLNDGMHANIIDLANHSYETAVLFGHTFHDMDSQTLPKGVYVLEVEDTTTCVLVLNLPSPETADLDVYTALVQAGEPIHMKTVAGRAPSTAFAHVIARVHELVAAVQKRGDLDIRPELDAFVSALVAG